MNALDKIISYFSPSAGLKRQMARNQSDFFAKKRKYDAASKDTRTSGWHRPSTGANSEIAKALTAVRDASRDLVRNNPLAGRACRLVSNYTIGKGVYPDFTGLPKRRDQIITAKFKMWAESTDCDFDGDLSFYGIQRAVMSALAESGEVLIRRRVLKFDSATIPLALQVIEADYLDTAKNEKIGNNRIKCGIEFDSEGRRVAYWLFDEHPGENDLIWRSYGASKRVPASEILHIFRKDRPGQIRGMPWGHSVIIKMKDLDDMHDAYLMRQKVAACWSAFIYESTPPAIDLNSQTQNEDGSVSERMQPGLIESLPPGKDIRFASPPGVDGISEFTADQIRFIAIAYGVTYESLSGNLKNVSFLSGRMGWLDMFNNIDNWQTDIVIGQLCAPVMKWAMESMRIHFPDLITDTIGVEWVMPGRSMLDPEKEFKVLKDMIRNGMPLYDALRRIGYSNPERALNRKADENKLLDELGLVLDCDPRKVTTAGNQVADSDPSTNNPDDTPDDTDSTEDSDNG